MPNLARGSTNRFMSWHLHDAEGHAYATNPNRLILSKGWAMFRSYPTIINNLQLQLLDVDLERDSLMPYPHIKLGEQDPRKLIIVRSKVPPTMKPVSYTVTVVFLTEEVSAGKYEVIEIRHAQCSCKAGLLEKEPHVAALLFAI